MKERFSGFIRQRKFTSSAFAVMVVVAVLLVNIILSTLTTAFDWYFYPQEQPDLSISDTFTEKFNEAKVRGEKVTVTFCMDENEVKTHSTGAYVYETAQKFVEKYGSFITLRYINLVTMYDQDGNDVSEELELYKKDMRGNEQPIYKSSIIFRSENSYNVVTDRTSGIGYVDFYTLNSEGYVTSYRGEEVFGSMINWVLNDDHGNAYFTVGHGESANQSLQTALICAGYYVDTINLKDNKKDADGVREVVKKLEGADLIIISNPTTDFEKKLEGSSVVTELELLRSYARDGGSFFVTIDPYVTNEKMANLFGLLSDFGISMLDHTENGITERQTIQDLTNGITTDGFTLVTEFGENATAQKMAELMGEKRVILRDVAPLKLSGEAKPLLVTSDSSECYANGRVTDSEGGYSVAAYSKLVSETGKTAELFFIPSVFLTATDAMVTNGYGNKDFVYSLFEVLYGVGDMPYGTNSIVYDSGVLENLTMGTAKTITAILLAIPMVLAVVGAVVLIRRKNR